MKRILIFLFLIFLIFSYRFKTHIDYEDIFIMHKIHKGVECYTDTACFQYVFDNYYSDSNLILVSDTNCSIQAIKNLNSEQSDTYRIFLENFFNMLILFINSNVAYSVNQVGDKEFVVSILFRESYFINFHVIEFNDAFVVKEIEGVCHFLSWLKGCDEI
jgi:hypothetical protein